LVQGVLRDYRTSSLSDGEKALFAFLEKVNGRSYELRREDVERVKHAGWSDEALYDAITVCALFNFYNRWCDAAGVHDMPPEAYAASGKRLAQRGYAVG
jgi:alkylhydroperoxidase family enzyme